ncbi:hypothetical protein LTR53_007125 [Teratosphaeriaceae sp. CCFEE 6253]|nr:hypothetical protein LTR53_007125 [Teratosphaeriaceae sp. CCFEE 6253]
MPAPSTIQPIKLYTHLDGPNPVKVALVLNELSVPFAPQLMDLRGPALKQEPYLSLNPNGRLPALEDPNTGIVVWESGACIDYLLETYDTEAKLSYTSGPEKWQQAAWKFFQVSGQGPYYGQKPWFMFYHPEKNLTSVLDRYTNEIHRVLRVIDAHLAKTGKPYLVGDKCTASDLMFISWNHLLTLLLGEEAVKGLEQSVPRAWAWVQRLEARDAVVKTYADVAKFKAELGEPAAH